MRLISVALSGRRDARCSAYILLCFYVDIFYDIFLLNTHSWHAYFKCICERWFNSVCARDGALRWHWGGNDAMKVKPMRRNRNIYNSSCVRDTLSLSHTHVQPAMWTWNLSHKNTHTHIHTCAHVHLTHTHTHKLTRIYTPPFFAFNVKQRTHNCDSIG